MPDIRWDVLTIGHLSRNKFWGESDERAYRAARCTSTLLRTGGRTIVVDPSCPPEEMTQVLDQRAGLRPEAVDIVFLTHFHGDHRYGIAAFPQARWCMAPTEIAIWDAQLPEDGQDRSILARLEPVTGELVPGVGLLATPGHTLGHHALVFDDGGLTVVVAADAAMTRDFFLAGNYYFNTVDPKAAIHSINTIAARADLVIPGHDNVFLHRRDSPK